MTRDLALEASTNIPVFLVVEDNSADVYLLRLAMDQIGESYILETLLDGEQALNFVEEHRLGIRDANPCVIILDLHLPRYNGLQILQAIRQTPKLSHIKVVVLTGLASPVEHAGIQAMGGHCLQKPSDLSGYFKLAEELFSICKGATRKRLSPNTF